MQKRFFRGATACCLAAAVVLGGCTTQSAKQTAGGVGAVAGGILGAVLGNNSKMGTAAGAAFGAMAGFIAGSLIGQLLDDADRARQEDATQKVLSEGDGVIRWNSEENPGVHGYSEVIETAPVAPARRKPATGQGENRTTESRTEVSQAPTGGACRTVREVAYVDGKEYTDMVEYCRPAGGGGWTRKTA